MSMAFRTFVPVAGDTSLLCCLRVLAIRREEDAESSLDPRLENDSKRQEEVTYWLRGKGDRPSDLTPGTVLLWQVGARGYYMGIVHDNDARPIRIATRIPTDTAQLMMFLHKSVSGLEQDMESFARATWSWGEDEFPRTRCQRFGDAIRSLVSRISSGTSTK